MGEVYRATHRMLARPAAVKLIRPEAIGTRERKRRRAGDTRFKREATSAANLQSPHTVELYDFGVTDDGTFYFAMELLEGMDLESLVRQNGPLPAARVMPSFAGLRVARRGARRGLVHRDIKPANIHLGRLGMIHDFVKVLDFGLVKSVADRAVDTHRSDRRGARHARLHGPEMALGQPSTAAPISTRSAASPTSCYRTGGIRRRRPCR